MDWAVSSVENLVSNGGTPEQAPHSLIWSRLIIQLLWALAGPGFAGLEGFLRFYLSAKKKLVGQNDTKENRWDSILVPCREEQLGFPLEFFFFF